MARPPPPGVFFLPIHPLPSDCSMGWTWTPGSDSGLPKWQLQKNLEILIKLNGNKDMEYLIK